MRLQGQSWLRLAAMACAGLICVGPAWAAEASESPNLFGDVGQAVLVIIIFLLLLGVLGKWAWKPIIAQLQRREDTIAQTIAEAQKRQQQAEELLAQYRARLDAAQQEAAELLAQTRKEAAAARQIVLDTAQKEVQTAAQAAREDIDRARAEALGELYDKTAQLAAEVAGRVIRKNLTREDQQRLLNDSLMEIRQQARN